MDLKIVKHSIDLMINAAMRINSFNIDNVHNLTVYDVDILRELVDDLKKNISDLELDAIVLNSNSVDESRFLLSKVLFIIEPYYSDPSHKDLIHIGSSFYLSSIELEIKDMTLLQSTYLSDMESLYYLFDFLHKRISSSLSSVSRSLNVYNTFNPAPGSVLINSNCSLNIQKGLDTERAQEVLQRAVNANILDKQQSENNGMTTGKKSLPLVLDNAKANDLLQKTITAKLCDDTYNWLKTKALLAYYVDRASEYLGLCMGEYDGKPKTSWKPFETLFGIIGLSGSKRDYQKTGTFPNGYRDVDRLFE